MVIFHWIGKDRETSVIKKPSVYGERLPDRALLAGHQPSHFVLWPTSSLSDGGAKAGSRTIYGERSRTMFVVAKVAKTLGISVDELLK
ncbi:MAG: hypothetical protein WC840_00795 [Candidatus Peribacteraceae bacterium]